MKTKLGLLRLSKLTWQRGQRVMEFSKDATKSAGRKPPFSRSSIYLLLMDIDTLMKCSSYLIL